MPPFSEAGQLVTRWIPRRSTERTGPEAAPNSALWWRWRHVAFTGGDARCAAGPGGRCGPGGGARPPSGCCRQRGDTALASPVPPPLARRWPAPSTHEAGRPRRCTGLPRGSHPRSGPWESPLLLRRPRHAGDSAQAQRARSTLVLRAEPEADSATWLLGPALDGCAMSPPKQHD